LLFPIPEAGKQKEEEKNLQNNEYMRLSVVELTNGSYLFSWIIGPNN
jgi:hypothetical protein